MNPSGMVDVFDLRLLAAVAETGSLGQAATRFGLSQPAVSMRMRALERRLGVVLMRRDPTGTRLSAAGSEILAAARPVLDSADTLMGVVARLRAQALGRLRIAASFTVAEHLAPAWIAAVRSKVPEVWLSLDVLNSAQVLSAVKEQRVDLGFVEGLDGPLPNLASETVATDELVVVAKPGSPATRRRTPLDGRSLARLEMVLREPGSGTRQVLERALAPYGGPTARLELGSSKAIIAAVRRGEGVAALSRLVVADDLALGLLAEVPAQGVNLTRTIRAVWLANTALSPLARQLLSVAHEPLTTG